MGEENSSVENGCRLNKRKGATVEKKSGHYLEGRPHRCCETVEAIGACFPKLVAEKKNLDYVQNIGPATGRFVLKKKSLMLFFVEHYFYPEKKDVSTVVERIHSDVFVKSEFLVQQVCPNSLQEGRDENFGEVVKEWEGASAIGCEFQNHSHLVVVVDHQFVFFRESWSWPY